MLKSLLREPLVHFLVLGAALFALDAWLRPPAAPAAATDIVVSEVRVRSLAQNFSRTWQRPPTREELDGLVASHVREEVMVREALALGLDRDDAIIRRRLQQKMDFVSDQAAELAEPSDVELVAYMKAHPDVVRTEPRVTFLQVYLDPARHARMDVDAQQLLGTLNAPNAPRDFTKAGDRLMLLEPRYVNTTQTELARLFGDAFAAAIVTQPVGAWVGPIPSGYGAHLVKLEALTPGGTAAIADVRPLVQREWTNARRQELSKAYYDKLRAKYKVTVQMPQAPKP